MDVAKDYCSAKLRTSLECLKRHWGAAPWRLFATYNLLMLSLLLSFRCCRCCSCCWCIRLIAHSRFISSPSKRRAATSRPCSRSVNREFPSCVSRSLGCCERAQFPRFSMELLPFSRVFPVSLYLLMTNWEQICLGFQSTIRARRSALIYNSVLHFVGDWLSLNCKSEVSHIACALSFSFWRHQGTLDWEVTWPGY